MSSYFYSLLCCRLLPFQPLYYLWGEHMQKQQLEKYRQLGLNISFYRKQRGYSQLQLAEMVNISRTHMSRIETADCAVSLDVVFAICEALRIPPAKLFDFRD